jgi:hypothetical protein
MKIKTQDLEGAALDWAVAKCEGYEDDCISDEWKYSTNWAQGGPIIEREGISTFLCAGDLGEPRSYWVATSEQQSWDWGYGPYHEQDEEKSMQLYKRGAHVGPTPLIAAMRCYVASKLGDEVEIPEGLK